MIAISLGHLEASIFEEIMHNMKPTSGMVILGDD